MSASRFATFIVTGFCVLTAAAGAACNSKPSAPASKPVSADAWASVNGKEITEQDVDKAFRRVQDPGQTGSPEEVLNAKLNLLSDLVVQEVLLAKAAELKLDVAQADLDNAYNNAKKNIPDEAFAQELTKRNLTPADMREGLRRELLTQKLLQQEVTSKVAVSEQEVTSFFDANRAQFNVAEESYHIAQIIVTPIRDPQLANGTGDDATTPQAAAAKVQMLMERLRAGASFHELAAGYSEDPDSARRGGDMGFVPVSRLKQAPPPLRDAVLGKAPGTATVATMNGAHTIVLVLAQEPAGQRELSSPGMRDRITERLRAPREQLLRTAYITALRTDAKVENYIARKLVESKGALPGGSPAASSAPIAPMSPGAPPAK